MHDGNLPTCLNFADLNTRSGLKKVHAKFDSIYQRIETVFQDSPHDIKLRGGIISIYAKMCIDSILRNRLFDEGLFDLT